MLKLKNNIDLFLIFLAIFFVLFGYVGSVITSVEGLKYSSVSGLDSSYVWIISYISTLQDKFLFGRDIFFNYGPLGYLIYAFPLKSVLIKFFIFNLSVSICFVYLFGCLLHLRQADKNKARFLFAFILFTLLFCTGKGNFEILACLSSLVFLYGQSRSKYISLLILSVFSSFMLFVKFNIGITFIATLFLALFIEILTNYLNENIVGFWPKIKNAIISSKTSLLIALPTFILLFFIAVFWCFHSFDYFIKWFGVSIELASTYQEAMSEFAQIHVDNPRMVSLIYLWCFITMGLICFQRPVKWKNIKFFIILLPSFFMLFKYSYGRAEKFHIITLGYWIMTLTPIMLVFFKKHTYHIISMLFFIFVLPAFYFWPQTSLLDVLEMMVNPPKIAEIQDEFANKFIESKNKLENSPKVEVLTFNVAPYAIKNNLNIVFNPFLQLFSAHSDVLDKISAKNYATQKADYLMIEKFMDIDGKNMILSTPYTYRKIRENYDVADIQNETIVLQKAKQPKPINITMHGSQTASLKEKIIVPPRAKLANIDIRLSFLGKMIKAIYKINPLFFRFYIKDEHGNINIKYVRVIRPSLKNGIYIEHLIDDSQMLAEWLDEKTLLKNKIYAFEVVTPTPYLYQDRIYIEWEK